ncbi:hypothetical protein [Actinocorallia populi]|uniref:hypothetical protein n=1 Tax=Actinocorallia populi TaxID=2079200 RepID=UPI0013004090|nr:hypothetical protein [Actinocorallia populi]
MSTPPAPATPTPPPPPDPAASRGRIGLWGPPASGKTTFLAALGLALDRGDFPWLLYGRDEWSNTFLSSHTDLLRQKTFPPATTDLSRELSWVFRGSRTIREGRLLRRSTREVVSELDLELIDAPGGYFIGRSQPAEPSRVRFDDDDDEEESQEERLYRHLGACHGLIYLFDPTRERTRKDSYDYFHHTVLQIARRSAARSGDRFLPQHLAVCITKFDHPHVYGPAFKNGFIDQTLNPQHFPAVPDDLAEELFEFLGEADRESSAVLLRNSIRRHFHPDRTRYFMTSAVGFYLDPDLGRFRHSQYWNVVEEEGDEGRTSRILGDVYPVNVVEPLAWLAETLLPRS